jgi:hypothetical protein
MDWAYRAVLTAVVVGAVMMAARLFGRRLAGLLAGLPVISAPALLWLAQEHGSDFAAASAVGGLAACAAAPIFAWGFERAASRHCAGRALAAGALCLALALVVVQPLEGRPLLALGVVAAVCLAVQRAPGRRGLVTRWVRPLRGEPLLSALLAGAVVAAVTLLAQHLGPFWSGVASALPVISACALVHLRLAAGAGEVSRFVTGYVPGIGAKALFLFVFAALAPWVGALWAALPALAAGWIGARALLRQEPAPRQAAAASIGPTDGWPPAGRALER